MPIRRFSVQQLLYIGMLLLATSMGHAAKTVIVYPQSDNDDDQRNAYPVQILDLALKKSGMDYVLKPCTAPMLQQRALTQLAQGIDIDVFWSMTSPEREEALTPIRIPIDKGLLGWRLFLIRKDTQKKFDQITSLNQLKSITAAQGHDWPDTQILRENGFVVQGVPNYENLFKMLQAGRVDYLPRSVGEIWSEADQYASQGLVIEKRLAIQYPTAEYFFVNKANKPLAAALEKGLNLAIRDGSFDKVFLQYYGDRLHRAHLKERRLFKLANPLLKTVPIPGQAKYWFNPS